MNAWSSLIGKIGSFCPINDQKQCRRLLPVCSLVGNDQKQFYNRRLDYGIYNIQRGDHPQSMSYRPVTHSLSNGSNHPPQPLTFKNSSRNALKRSMGPLPEKRATFTSMFCNPLQRPLQSKMSMQQNSSQDFNGYVLGLVEKDQKQPNPFTQAKLRALVSKDSLQTEKTTCSLNMMCREVTAVEQDCEGESEQVTLKQISQRERMKKSMVISCITTTLT